MMVQSATRPQHLVGRVCGAVDRRGLGSAIQLIAQQSSDFGADRPSRWTSRWN